MIAYTVLLTRNEHHPVLTSSANSPRSHAGCQNQNSAHSGPQPRPPNKKPTPRAHVLTNHFVGRAVTHAERQRATASYRRGACADISRSSSSKAVPCDRHQHRHSFLCAAMSLPRVTEGRDRAGRTRKRTLFEPIERNRRPFRPTFAHPWHPKYSLRPRPLPACPCSGVNTSSLAGHRDRHLRAHGGRVLGYRARHPGTWYASLRALIAFAPSHYTFCAIDRHASPRVPLGLGRAFRVLSCLPTQNHGALAYAQRELVAPAAGRPCQQPSRPLEAAAGTQSAENAEPHAAGSSRWHRWRLSSCLSAVPQHVLAACRTLRPWKLSLSPKQVLLKDGTAVRSRVSVCAHDTTSLERSGDRCGVCARDRLWDSIISTS